MWRRLPISLICSLGLSVAILGGAHPSALLAQERRVPSTAPAVPETATEPQGWFPEPEAVETAALFGDRHLVGGGTGGGWFVDFGNMIPGSGWISLGSGYRWWADNDRAVFDASGGISWRGYKAAQLRYERLDIASGKITLGSQLLLQDFTQIATFGPGPDSIVANLSEYRLTSGDVVGYATWRPFRWLSVNANTGWLQPSISRRAGLFLRDRPDARDVFPGDLVFARADQPAFLHNEASVVADTRDFAGHPTRGGLWRVAAADYSDHESRLFSFRRYEVEGAQFIRLGESGSVVVLHGWVAASDTNSGSTVPFYLQPALGGANTLRSYADYRFRDRNMAVFNAEVRVPLLTHVDLAAFVDAGNVAARLDDLDLARRSYGAGLRLHSRRQTFARLDVARGDEGWRVLFRMNDPFSLTRISGRTASVPFVP